MTQYAGVPDGWTRLFLQVPIGIAKTLQTAARREGPGGMKLLGTTAVATFLGLPEPIRAQLIDYVAHATRRDPAGADPAEAMRILLDGLAELQQHERPRSASPARQIEPRPARRKTGS